MLIASQLQMSCLEHFNSIIKCTEECRTDIPFSLGSECFLNASDGFLMDFFFYYYSFTSILRIYYLLSLLPNHFIQHCCYRGQAHS
jgi:hypothetical protein